VSCSTVHQIYGQDYLLSLPNSLRLANLSEVSLLVCEIYTTELNKSLRDIPSLVFYFGSGGILWDAATGRPIGQAMATIPD
jgi:hypothetical protein